MKKTDTDTGINTGRENKPHIGIFGRCNSGKSTLLNYIVGTGAAIVSPEKGTTTDVVRRGFEITGFAPVVFMDTPGFDDDSALGLKRMEKTAETLCQIDLAILVFREWSAPERDFLLTIEKSSVPYILVHNISGESDGGGIPDTLFGEGNPPDPGLAPFAELPGDAIRADLFNGGDESKIRIFEKIKKRLPENSYKIPSMFGGRVKPGDFVLLVCLIDVGAPAGRLILPQVQALRELLDTHAVAMTVQPGGIEAVLAKGIVPELVVTDSQVYAEVRKTVPGNIEVTSFSILLASAKGDMALYEEGLKAVDKLKAGDKVLVAESCSHHVGCEDIGRVKIPAWLERYAGCGLEFTFVPGLSPLPDDISSYAIMLQCGGCMVTGSQLRNRLRKAASAGVPVTNYGMLIKKITG